MQQRRIGILQAIVSDYVSTREPVGSTGLVKRYNLGVSPATVRNDMAALEESGYIYQPHTSAGRIPTDRGYRMFVDQISAIKPLSIPQRRAIDAFLSNSVDVDDAMDRTVRLLAKLTNQVAIVQYPFLQRRQIRHVELVPVDSRRVLLIIIFADGEVSKAMLDLTVEISETEVDRIRQLLNQYRDLEQFPTFTSPEQLATLFPTDLTAAEADLLAQLGSTVQRDSYRQSEQRMVVAGTGNLARAGHDFNHTIVPVLDALEEQIALLQLFSRVGDERLAVSIGSENAHDALAETSIITGSYRSGNDASSHLGVVGPTRMDYPTTMATVRAVAGYLSRYLEN